MGSVYFLALLLALLSLSFQIHAEDVTIINRCSQSIYVKSEVVQSPPFHLAPNGGSRTVTANRIPAKTPGPRPRVWAHTGCNAAGGNCDTNEGYVSLAEFNYNEHGQIWYDVSQVDGYNLPITMEVPGNPSGGRCSIAQCFFNIDQNCPGHLKRMNKGRAVACENKERENHSSDYVQSMKASCPGAYTYSGDDAAGMRDCRAGNNALKITFC